MERPMRTVSGFILAEAGLLDHRHATTTWWLAPLFRQRYPKASLDETRMLVVSERVVTTGAAMGHLDLALWLIRQASPELAAVVARSCPWASSFWSSTKASRRMVGSFFSASRTMLMISERCAGVKPSAQAGRKPASKTARQRSRAGRTVVSYSAGSVNIGLMRGRRNCPRGCVPLWHRAWNRR